MPTPRKARVLLALSGGVDSSVAGLLLQRAGYDVGCAYLVLHEAGAAEAHRARQAAGQLGLPLAELDFQDRFSRLVQEPFRQAWAEGLTPNPCVVCNQTVKFGALLDYARAEGYDCLATGHYARTSASAEGRTLLLRAADPDKDQSYFLAGLRQDQLAFARFPLGELTKPQVRALAAQAGLSAAGRRDSQDVCFIPQGDYAAWLEQTGFSFTPGRFVDPAGKDLGPHRGAERYPLGQRRGLGLALGDRAYVTGRNRGDVVVGPESDLLRRTVYLRGLNCIPQAQPETVPVEAKLRYRQRPAPAMLIPTGDGTARLEFETPQRAPAPGQLAVCYQGDKVYAGGWITRAPEP